MDNIAKLREYISHIQENGNVATINNISNITNALTILTDMLECCCADGDSSIMSRVKETERDIAFLLGKDGSDGHVEF